MNPYEILGVSPDVSDEELKRAYRNLAKKYHPDRYADSPLAESASEKMKQINEAYDIIQEQRKKNNTSGSTYYGTAKGSGRSYQRMDNVRELINTGWLDDAERILMNTAPDGRDAEWYYLMGVVTYRKGYLEEAYHYFETACQLAPENAEYRTFYDRVRGSREGHYRGGYDPYDPGMSSCGGCDVCNVCGGLMCADCLCSCCNCY